MKWGARPGLPVVMLLWLLVADPVTAARALPDFTALVETSSAAVVNISTTQQHAPPRVDPPIAEHDDERPLDELFRRFFDHDRGGAPEAPPFAATSLGSGFLISDDGYILTSYHVVRGADEILVTLSDRRQFVATTVGHDEESDLALLKVDARDLPVARLGSAHGLKVGEWVVAIGSPFGFEHSVTAGIVSAKGRSLRSERFVPFIQTDVAINPGNSGGPLFNLDGEVIGINSQIYSRTGGFQGVSFAIPVELALDVVEQLRASGRVSRGWLGVNIQDVSRELAQSFGMVKPEGALVTRVLPGSPASQAGLQPGDIILRFDGTEVERSAMLPQLVGGARADRTVPLELLREGRRRDISVALDELPRRERIARARIAEPETPGHLGLAVDDLTDDQRQRHELPRFGVLVTEVGRGPAQRGGVRSGDVILMVDQVRVRDSAHFANLAADLRTDRPVPFLVQRGSVPVFLAIRAGAAE